PRVPSPLTCSCPAALLQLPSFPTRRSSDLPAAHRRPPTGHPVLHRPPGPGAGAGQPAPVRRLHLTLVLRRLPAAVHLPDRLHRPDRKSTRLNSSHVSISYAVFCLKKKIITI